jgi:hypothetical protein
MGTEVYSKGENAQQPVVKVDDAEKPFLRG